MVEWQFIAIPALAVVVLLLFSVLVLAIIMFMRKREMLCFKKRRRRRSKRYDEETTTSFYRNSDKPPKKPSGLKRRRPNYSDPFAHRFTDPLHMEQGFENFDITQWDNPLFDAKGARERDAAITIQSWWRMVRARIYFLEMREIALIFQKCWKGRQERKKLPQYKREKHEREQRRKREPGYIRHKGTLSALKFYDVKGYGFCEVQQLYGQETMHKAAEQLRSLYGGKGQKRFKLFISVKAVLLYDHTTWRHFATVKMSTISFCSLDFKNKKLFAFINMKKKRKFCHVFQCHEGDAQKLVETMGEAFEVTFKQEKQKKEEERIAAQKRQEFRQSAMDLDKEVNEMMKLAESASIATPSLNRPTHEMSDSPKSLTPKSGHHSPNLSSFEQSNIRYNPINSSSTDSPLLVSQRIPYYGNINQQRNFSSLERGLDNINYHHNKVMVQHDNNRPRSRTLI